MSENYSEMSTDELKQLYYTYKHESEIYSISQLVKKILLNSCYGACGNNFFLYYAIELARSITLMGQCMINKAALEKNRFISKCLNKKEICDYRLYSDTDSNYVDLSKVTQKLYEIKPDATQNEATDFIDKFCKKIESDCLSPLFEKVKNECNCHSNAMHMDREAIAIGNRKTGYSGLWVAKKRYYLLLSDMEDFRYDEPHEKIMGLYSVTSGCPEFVKPVYNSVLHALVTEGIDEARNIISSFKYDFYNKSISDIAFPMSVSDVIRYTDPKTKMPWEGKWMDTISGKERNGGVPINARAAINYNFLIHQLDLDKKYQTIKDGTKMRFVYLKENPYKFPVIGFIDDLPKEFQLDEYVDIDTHWNKIFYKPIDDIFTACGLTIKKTCKMSDFFD